VDGGDEEDDDDDDDDEDEGDEEGILSATRPLDVIIFVVTSIVGP
jgi:hypothetical protein